jgi:hypothetical protein
MIRDTFFEALCLATLAEAVAAFLFACAIFTVFG